MNRFAIVVVLLAACANKAKQVGSVANNGADPIACPIPANTEIRERFAVGAVFDYRVRTAGSPLYCRAEPIANEVVTITNGSAKLVKEGTFKGHCPGQPESVITFEAVKAAKATVGVATMPAGTPIELDSKAPEKTVQVLAGLADRCGGKLSMGIQDENPTTWTAGAGCDNVAKIVPWNTNNGMPGESARSALTDFAAVGPGTCTISVELLGAKGEVTLTVK